MTKNEEQQPIQLLTHAIENSLEGIIIGDATGIITYINTAVQKMYGCEDKNEVLGKHILDLISPQDKAKTLEKEINNLKSREAWIERCSVLTKQGSTIPVEISVTPLKDADQTLISFLTVLRNNAERVNCEKQLRAANEKLLVVGGLVRHDIANKLSVLNLNVYSAKKSGKMEGLLSAAQTISAQITRTLEFSRDYEMLGQEELSYIDVGATFNEVAALFPAIKNLQVVNGCSRVRVLADSLLKELLYNLVDDTLKYGETTTQITLSCHQEEGALKIVYEDNGVGISAAMKKQLFHKGSGKGTGLGLYLIKKIVEVYGWQIEETGTQGRGARFEMTIPQQSRNQINYKLPT